MAHRKKVAVFGSNGMLGYAVSEYFSREGWDVSRITRADFDIAKDPWSMIERFVDRTDAVVNCAGVIKPMIEKTSIEDILKVNAIFPRNLAKFCLKKSIPCFHITTDCVFSGRKGKYTEDDLFDADDVYGMSKNAGEDSDCMVLRTSIIGKEKGQSRSLLEWAIGQTGKDVNGFINHFWNGVTTLFLAEIIMTILNTNIYEQGVFHIFSRETVSKYDLLRIISDAYALNLRVKEFEAPERCDRSLATIFRINNTVSNKSIKLQLEQMHSYFR